MKKQFQIKEPCSVARESMQEFIGRSFCDLCSKQVYDLADKTDDEIKLLLQFNPSIYGRIQADRLYISEKKPEPQYHLSLPFRKIAGGIFLSILFTSNFDAQKKQIDTLSVREIQEMVWISPRSMDEDDGYPEPIINRKLEIKPSIDSKNLIQYQSISILTPRKRFSSSRALKNHITIPADYVKMSNIFVFEDDTSQNGALNDHTYFLFVNKLHIREDETIDINMDQVKNYPFTDKNKDFLYFLDGDEITKKEFEQYQKDNKIDAYFLPEIYAEELFGDDYYFENGAIVSYRK